MRRRRPSEQEHVVEEANVLPVMNIMFLLIPALLLAMETASMAGIAISPPKLCGGCQDSSEPTTEQEPLELTVTILADGHRVTAGGQQHGADAGRAQDSRSPTIPLARPDAAAADYDRYDYAALEDLARDYKRKHPKETVVRVSAENDIPAQVLINTLDALRGSDCKLRQAQSEDGVSECLFFRPIVSAGG